MTIRVMLDSPIIKDIVYNLDPSDEDTNKILVEAEYLGKVILEELISGNNDTEYIEENMTKGVEKATVLGAEVALAIIKAVNLEIVNVEPDNIRIDLEKQSFTITIIEEGYPDWR